MLQTLKAIALRAGDEHEAPADRLWEVRAAARQQVDEPRRMLHDDAAAVTDLAAALRALAEELAGLGLRVELVTAELGREPLSVEVEALVHELDRAEELSVVGAAQSVEEWDAKASDRPDVVVLDLNLPGLSGATAVEHVAATGVSVLVLSASANEEAVVDPLGTGAKGYLFKDTDGVELVTAAPRSVRGQATSRPRSPATCSC